MSDIARTIERLYFIERIDTAQIARWYDMHEAEVWNILAHGDPARKWPKLWRAVKKRLPTWLCREG